MATITAVTRPDRDRRYAELVRTLRDFEGWRTLSWLLPLSALASVAVPAVAIGAGVLAAAISAGEFGLSKAFIAATIASLATIYVHPRLARRKLHRKLIANRLWTWEEPNPATHVDVLLCRPDIAAAVRVLRRARFNPSDYAARLGTSAVPDAPELDMRMGVEEPEAHPQSGSDEDRVRRIAGALEAAGIRARVGGIDVPRPGGVRRAV